MSRIGQVVQELQEQDDSFDRQQWIGEVVPREKASLPPPKADNGNGFAPTSEPYMY